MAHTRKSNMLSRRSFRLALALMLIGIAGYTLLTNNRFLSRNAQAAGFVVTNTNDSGAGSLRKAIDDSNNNGSAVTDTITFNIPGGGVKTIKPLSPLPAIQTPVTIDGYTQPNSSANTNVTGAINAVPLIELDGSSAGAGTEGLFINGSAVGTVIRGLVINRFDSAGIRNNSSSVKIEGCFIGTNAAGTMDLGNAGSGVLLFDDPKGKNIVGGLSAAARNLISGNSAHGVSSAGPDNAGPNTIQGNLIGTDKSGVLPLGNSGDGIAISGSGWTIGGTAAAAGNIVSSNQSGRGVAVTGSGLGNSILGNSIYANASLGIDLKGDGVTANDVGDGDTGPNALQNYPVLSSAVSNNGSVTVGGGLNGPAGKQYRLEFFANNQCDGTGFGEGEKIVGTTNLTSTGGTTVFTFVIPSGVAAGQFITATATDPLSNTSEFSQCIQALEPAPVISIDDISFAEGNQGMTMNATFAVTLSKASAQTVTVKYLTQSGTASAVDYQSAGTTTLTFAPGETSKNVTILVNGDNYQEPDETFFVNLSQPTNATIGDNQGKATILNDDVAPTITITDVSAAEGNGPTDFTFTVTLSYGSAQVRSVDFMTADGTAVAGKDYQPQSNTLTFSIGQSQKTITVLVNGNTDIEGDKTFVVNLLNPVDATIAKAQGKGTILNDDKPAGPEFNFNSEDMGIKESLGAAVVTVVRSGDVSGPASVDYTTVDNAAVQKSDYEFAAGKLYFAPGETSKTLTILINEDSYVEGNETFKVTLSNPSGATLGKVGTISVAIVDDVVESLSNPIDDTESFIYMHYHDFLNREPDAAGLQFWVNEIENCGADAQCRENKRINVSAAFFLSIEFQETGYLRYLIEKESFGSTPKYIDFMRDVQELSNGVIVNAPGWEPKLRANQKQFADEWVKRPAFKAVYDSMSNADFVNAIYNNAGIVSSQEARNSLVSSLDANNGSRADVLLLVAADASFKQKEYNAAFVMMQYFGYLRRDPNAAPDVDLSGYNFWLNKLNQFGGNYADAEMIKAFITSFEYRGRFSQ